ncbi:hypothetical protein Scep_004113 [Stephania cephalantha]|uniref:Uncharacterized protein n=1 Tax=Stephania cephalantha TaxID=152367 RepID=A0AAP0PWZ5_9MAGN
MVRQPGMQSVMHCSNAGPFTLLFATSSWLTTLPAMNISTTIAITTIAVTFFMLPMITYLDR